MKEHSRVAVAVPGGFAFFAIYKPICLENYKPSDGFLNVDARRIEFQDLPDQQGRLR